MILGHLRLTILFIILLISLNGFGQKVLITNTRTESATQLMDLSWKRAANLVGATSEIIDQTYLDSLHILQTAEVVILASGIKETTTSQQNTLQKYIQSGGNVYVQGEFKINFSGNQLFKHLVNKTGGQFDWIGETKNNLNPITFPSFITGGSPVQLEYHWNGTYGCGGETIFPIAIHNDLQYGFIHISNNEGIGRIMTTTDQDWIKIATEVGKTHRLTLMKNLLQTLINGIEHLVTPNIRINYLQQSLCPGTPYDIEAKIDETILDYQVEWFKNGLPQEELTNKTKFESAELTDGDILQAKMSMFPGCQASAIESNIVEIERVFPLSMSTPNIIGNTMICAGEKGIFIASIDEMPDPAIVTYKWIIDGIDQQINNDTLIIDNPINNSEVQLSVSFNDGCTMVDNSTQSITLQIIGRPIPTISLNQDKNKYCNLDDAQIELVGISEDYNYTVSWNVDGRTIPDLNTKNYNLPSLTNDHEVYAVVNYDDPCQGQIQLSTPVANIAIDHPNLVITAKQNTSCDRENGSITVTPEGGTQPYSYQWEDESDVKNPIVGLPIGMHTIKVIDANGCEAEASTSIGAVQAQIIDSLIILEQSCDSGESALVQLYPNPSFKDDLSIKWTDSEGNSINGDFTEGEFETGQFMVEAFVDENCSEKRGFEIKAADILGEIKKTFESEAEFFVTLDLGIDPALIANINWIGGDDILNCTDCTWPSFLATENQVFEVELESTGGCAYVFEVNVNVSAVEKLPYFAPSGFSPDGDDNNDYFEFFTDNTVASLQELLIFDRWGNLVYEAEELDTTLHWDGNFNGLPSERGVYVYVAKMVGIDGNEIVASGSISLFRK